MNLPRLPRVSRFRLAAAALLALALPALAAAPATNAPPRRRGFARQEAEAAAFLASDPSPLARFLDTQFGPYDNSPSRFLKLREPFGPFRWIRCVQDREGRQCLVDGELVFLAEEDADPAPLVSSLESLRGAFERDWAVSFESPAACARPDDVLFLSGTNGAYRVAVELRDDGPVDDPAGGGAGLRRLVARFEVWNAVLAPYRDFGRPPRQPRLWSEVFAPIVVRAAGAADPSAWIYRPPEGPSTEEILREAIRLRDGKHAEAVAGAPVGTRFGGGGREVGAEDARAFFRAAPDGGAHGYFCTEAEADGVLDAFGEPRFVRFADRDETARIYRLFLTPAALRPRKPGERRWHGEECPDGEILPGDRLVWHTGEFRDRNEGVVCAEGEDGVPVAAFGGVRVKDVRTTEAPRPEDRDWTAFHDWREKSETMRRRAWEINRAAKEAPDDLAALGRAVAFLRELDALDEPGLYTAPHGESSLETGDRAQVRAYVARRTREAREWFQFALRDCRAIVASGFARLELADGRLRRFLPDETAAALADPARPMGARAPAAPPSRRGTRPGAPARRRRAPRRARPRGDQSPAAVRRGRRDLRGIPEPPEPRPRRLPRRSGVAGRCSSRRRHARRTRRAPPAHRAPRPRARPLGNRSGLRRLRPRRLAGRPRRPSLRGRPPCHAEHRRGRTPREVRGA